MNCGPNCGWDRSKAERSGIMINTVSSGYATVPRKYCGAEIIYFGSGPPRNRKSELRLRSGSLKP
jgi:hypothetical protein